MKIKLKANVKIEDIILSFGFILISMGFALLILVTFNNFISMFFKDVYNSADEETNDAKKFLK